MDHAGNKNNTDISFKSFFNIGDKKKILLCSSTTVGILLLDLEVTS